MSPEQRALYDAIVGGPRASGPALFRLVDERGALEGPFNAFLLHPPIGEALQAVGAAVRYRGRLTDRAREIAILLVAAHRDSAFERYAHEAVGAAAGLSPAELDAVRRLRPGTFEDDAERLVADTTLALLEDGDLDDDRYAAFTARFDEATLFELLTLVGYYTTLALQLNVFRVAAPDGGGRA
ncbi:MAG: carboxymuconolactone decarboxylase family protein [Actinobacteria bacterium]|nr:carboxymuconolactone decarboxylase family protein [Actinomycetota bacterium]